MNKSKSIWTIPNILAMIRILFVPVFVILFIKGRMQYLNEGGTYYNTSRILAIIVAVVSGLTDVLDGKIARKYNLVSELGIALDPVADKLYQLSTFFCLALEQPILWIPGIVLLVKEIITGIFASVVLKKIKMVFPAVWHGKLSSVIIFVIMALQLFWPGCPDIVILILTICSVGIMLYSGYAYIARYIRVLKRFKKGDTDFSDEGAYSKEEK